MRVKYGSSPSPDRDEPVRNAPHSAAMPGAWRAGSSHAKHGGGVRGYASETPDFPACHANSLTPPHDQVDSAPHCPAMSGGHGDLIIYGWVPSPRFARGGTRSLAQLPFLLLAVFGLYLIGEGAIIPAKAWLAQILLDRAFEQSRAQHRPVKAWPWADAVPIARIRVPRLGVEQIVLSGGSGEAMAFGPTLLPGGGRLGERGTAVLAAHRDTHFRFLADLRPGDLILVERSDGPTLRYRAGAGRVVRKDRFAVDRHATRPRLALTTCWPIGGSGRGPWRYVVGTIPETSG